jgi:polyisoprenoid-binding protein YceI
MKKMLFTALSLLFMYASNAQTTAWNLDKVHSSVGFSIAHMVVSETVGQFDDFTMDVKSDKPDFTDAIVDLTIQVASINTKDAGRDKHLKTEDFFNADKYPTITFKSKSFKQVKGNKYKVTGDFTMMGVTKTVTLDAQFNGMIKDSKGKFHAGLKVYGEIDRYQYGLKYNSPLEGGGFALGQMVNINCNVELIK